MNTGWAITIGALTILSGIGLIVDKALSEKSVEKVKNEIAKWWIDLSDEVFSFRKTINSSLLYFTKLFNSIYGKKHFSWKCFFRSGLSSFGSIVVIIIILEILYSDVEKSLYLLLRHKETNIYNIIIMILQIAPVNVIVDYFSLIQSRIFLKLSLNKNISALVIFLFCDLLISGAIYIFLYTPLIFVLYELNISTDEGILLESIEFKEIYRYTYMVTIYPLIESTHTLSLSQILGTYFFKLPLTSTFFTSFLFYCFFLSSVLISILGKFRAPIRKILYWLNSLKNPVTSLVGILGGIILIVKGVHQLVQVYF